jgi:hypothetical protein
MGGLLTSPGVAENAELAESLSMGLLVVLETLTLSERAVFVLHESSSGHLASASRSSR